MCFATRRGHGYNHGCVLDLYSTSSLSRMKNKTYLKELFKKYATHPERMVRSFVSNINIL